MAAGSSPSQEQRLVQISWEYRHQSVEVRPWSQCQGVGDFHPPYMSIAVSSVQTSRYLTEMPGKRKNRSTQPGSTGKRKVKVRLCASFFLISQAITHPKPNRNRPFIFFLLEYYCSPAETSKISTL